LFEPPSRDNHRKAPYPRTQQLKKIVLIAPSNRYNLFALNAAMLLVVRLQNYTKIRFLFTFKQVTS